jgi:hypothetical protein
MTKELIQSSFIILMNGIKDEQKRTDKDELYLIGWFRLGMLEKINVNGDEQCHTHVDYCVR